MKDGDGKEARVGVGALGLERALELEEYDFGADSGMADERRERFDAIFDLSATAKEAQDAAEEPAPQLVEASAAARQLNHSCAEQLETGPRGARVDGACGRGKKEETRVEPVPQTAKADRRVRPSPEVECGAPKPPLEIERVDGLKEGSGRWAGDVDEESWMIKQPWGQAPPFLKLESVKEDESAAARSGQTSVERRPC